MPKLIGKKARVVEHDGLSIDELVGNVSTGADTLSVAIVNVSRPTSEPWLTLAYDEWICIITGQMDLHYVDAAGKEQLLVASAGETAFIAAGERFRPIFTVAPTSYIPVCLPAFTPDRCVREEEESDVADRLAQLHGKGTYSPAVAAKVDAHVHTEVLYHMCQKSLWDEAVEAKRAYFPPTFVEDGSFTHATAVPERLVTTANHFYQATTGDLICLQLSRSALLALGVETVFEEAKPVGKTATGDWDTWICPHVKGGLTTTVEGVVTKVYRMKRDTDGKFVSIEGLTD